MDLDGDGKQSAMDTDGKEVSGDEKIVLVLDNKEVKPLDSVQFFDNVVKVTDVYTSGGGSLGYKVCDNEGGIQVCSPPRVLESERSRNTAEDSPTQRTFLYQAG